jgi:NDP-sugar pyrophosphorylase family protein
MAQGARVHKSSRLVAPIYIGRSTKVARSAVIARFSNLEHHCRVGEGTVVDAATVLAHTALGGGLDVSHAMVDGNEFMDLERNVALRIEDPKLIRDTTPRPWLALVHPDYAAQPMRDKNSLESLYSQHLSRPAGKLWGALFKGYAAMRG